MVSNLEPGLIKEIIDSYERDLSILRKEYNEIREQNKKIKCAMIFPCIVIFIFMLVVLLLDSFIIHICSQ